MNVYEKVTKLLGLLIDKQLKFNKHLAVLYKKKVSGKVSILARSFIESQFSYCPLIWMFCSRIMNTKINQIHERALRLVYEDYSTPFKEILVRIRSVSIHHRNIQCPKFLSSLFCRTNTQTRLLRRSLLYNR